MPIKEPLETRILRWLCGERMGWSLGLFLAGLAKLYAYGMGWRRLAYERGWLKSRSVGVPLVSIGNIAVGGTGKTPFCLLLARRLQKEGVPLAILSRGYRSLSEKESLALRVSDPIRILCDAILCGDEPYLLALGLPGVSCYVAKKRITIAQMAVEEGAKLLIADDAFQHQSLFRDWDVVLVDAEAPFSNGWTLPRGLLREAPSALRGARLIVLYPVSSPLMFSQLKQQLASYTSAPLIGCGMTVDGLWRDPGEPVIRGAPYQVILFSAIAKPERFLQTAQSSSLHVLDYFVRADHAVFTENEYAEMDAQLKEKRGDYLVCTEKDWVKIPKSILKRFPIVFLRVGMEVRYGQEIWEEFLIELSNSV